MTHVWDVFFGEWSNGWSGAGWETWMEHVLMPLIVLILLSNVSVVRVLLELQHGPKVDARIPRFSRLLAPPFFSSGASLLIALFATRHPWARPLADASQTVAALTWVVTAIRLSMVVARLTAAQHGPARPRRHGHPSDLRLSKPHAPDPTMSGS